jgi:hypothetical protein
MHWIRNRTLPELAGGAAFRIPANCADMAAGFVTGAAIGLLLNILMRSARRTHGAEEGGYPYTSRAPLL